MPLPAPEALLPLLLPELELLLLEHAVSRRAAAAAAARPRAARVDTVMLRLLNVLGSLEPDWVFDVSTSGRRERAGRSTRAAACEEAQLQHRSHDL